MKRSWGLDGLLRVGRGVAIAVLALAIAWAAGLLWFAAKIPRRVADPATHTDAIVVLTGGSSRLAEGLALLDARRAGKLFISGVYRGVEAREVLRLAGRAPAALEGRVALGYEATNTRGNATETAVWMRAEGFTSLRLVTANYHMPRSLAEFARAMPEVRLVPHPVFPDHVRVDRWWRWPGTAYLLAEEFTKYLVVMMRGAGRGP